MESRRDPTARFPHRGHGSGKVLRDRDSNLIVVFDRFQTHTVRREGQGTANGCDTIGGWQQAQTGIAGKQFRNSPPLQALTVSVGHPDPTDAERSNRPTQWVPCCEHWELQPKSSVPTFSTHDR